RCRRRGSPWERRPTRLCLIGPGWCPGSQVPRGPGTVRSPGPSWSAAELGGWVQADLEGVVGRAVERAALFGVDAHELAVLHLHHHEARERPADVEPIAVDAVGVELAAGLHPLETLEDLGPRD